MTTPQAEPKGETIATDEDGNPVTIARIAAMLDWGAAVMDEFAKAANGQPASFSNSMRKVAKALSVTRAPTPEPAPQYQRDMAEEAMAQRVEQLGEALRPEQSPVWCGTCFRHRESHEGKRLCSESAPECEGCKQGVPIYTARNGSHIHTGEDHTRCTRPDEEPNNKPGEVITPGQERPAPGSDKGGATHRCRVVERWPDKSQPPPRQCVLSDGHAGGHTYDDKGGAETKCRTCEGHGGWYVSDCYVRCPDCKPRCGTCGGRKALDCGAEYGCHGCIPCLGRPAWR